MPLLARMMFGLVNFAARKGLREAVSAASEKGGARQTGIRGETYAYWYLRRYGYILIARNYTSPGVKGEIDLAGFDGDVLAFVEVKTRSSEKDSPARPEDAVTQEKRRNLARMAGQFLRERRLTGVPHRFDVLAIESRPGQRPVVRLHKDAFTLSSAHRRS